MKRLRRALLGSIAVFAAVQLLVVATPDRGRPSVAVAAVEPAPFMPTGFGAAYDDAVSRMVAINHLLERRQTELARALRDNAPRCDVASLRAEVRSLEIRYENAIADIGAEGRR